MRLAELSKLSGVSTATIKYYLREGLLRPGRQVNATTAEYDEEHLRRLRLVRAMIQVGRVPVATVREVLGHVDDDSLGRTVRLGAALWALPHVPEPDTDDEHLQAAQHEASELLRALGWRNAELLTTISPAFRSLVVAVAAMRRLDFDWDAELLMSYARLMHRAAVLDLDFVETRETEAERVETAVLGTILVEPMLQALHRLAQEEESARRYGFE
ncbi:MerR family transcriptional regulator [Streptomyces sp. ID05-47C]|uniref:MerR family transcriptional regulator n=1 Tax=Streptomyces sp. ID05-47C TaxID=3028665 RepID=UPI0029AE2303|nr:MerR family transcriptional regulator [Streptomyces sp. ID05-47C]MDX3568880.1 MerR family transcriptional regulator [Streptomyces sp. ID05-47C]